MPNFLERVIGGAVNTVKNTRVDLNNPFDGDGKGGINVSVGNLGGVGINVETGATGAEIKASVRTGAGRGAITSSIGAEAGISGVGVFGESSTEGLGSSKIVAGVGKDLLNYQNRDKDGNLRVDANLIPIDSALQIGQNILDILEADRNIATNRAYEDYNNRTRKPPQSSTRPNQQSQQRQPQSQQRQPQSQQRQPQSQQRQPQSQQRQPQSQQRQPQSQQTRPKEISDEDSIAQGETFKPAEPGGAFSSKKSTATQSGSRGQTAFTIPTNIPNTNARLPKKPQIGSSGVQQNTRLGNRTQNQGGRIVRPEDLEDISANNPNNKPRINQPPQKTEPPRAYRLLTPREKQLFDCVQNGGGDACNKKYGEAPKPSNSNGGSDEGISLSLGDPYIGMGGG